MKSQLVLLSMLGIMAAMISIQVVSATQDCERDSDCEGLCYGAYCYFETSDTEIGWCAGCNDPTTTTTTTTTTEEPEEEQLDTGNYHEWLW